MAYPTASVILWAKISQCLAEQDIAISKASGAPYNEGLPQLLYIERTSLEWKYGKNSADSTLVATGNYVYALCGKYITRAKYISGTSSIGFIATGINNELLSNVPHVLQFSIGDGDSPMTAGATVLTIVVPNIQIDTLKVTVDGSRLLRGRSDRFSYNVTVNSSQAVITFNQAVYDTQSFIIDYFTSS